MTNPKIDMKEINKVFKLISENEEAFNLLISPVTLTKVINEWLEDLQLPEFYSNEAEDRIEILVEDILGLLE